MEMVEPDSEAVEENARNIAPPLTTVVELVAAQLETVEPDSDAVEEEKRYMAPPLLAVQSEMVEPHSNVFEE